MDNQLGFIFKVLIGSTILSVLVKYGGRVVAIAPSNLNATIAITLPAVIILGILLWRRQKFEGE